MTGQTLHPLHSLHAIIDVPEQVLMAGVGFHSAGLEQADRAVVEQLFLEGHLPVRCHCSRGGCCVRQQIDASVSSHSTAPSPDNERAASNCRLSTTRPQRDVDLEICMPQVLCATSTLALGVNLPAHLVIVMSTRRWSKEDGDVAGYKEYDRTTCLQMIGRSASSPVLRLKTSCSVGPVLSSWNTAHQQFC